MDSLTSSFTPLCAPNLRPAGTSFQRKEGSIHSKRPTFSPLPLEGAAWRSETGLAPPYVGNAFPLYRYPHHFRASPFIKISAERCSGAFVSSDLCKNVFPSVSPAFHTASALSAPSGHLPLEGKAPIREYPLLKRRRTTLVIPSAPRIVIPSAAEGSLLHCRHMHTCALTQTTPWCFLFRLSLTHGLPLCKKDPSTSALMTRKKDDSLTSSFTPLRRVVPLRGTLSCAFGAALFQGPTRIIGVTGD